MDGWKFWWGVAAFFLGGTATQLNGWLTYRRQRADKRRDDKDAAAQRRDEFELNHLLEINQLLRDYGDGMVHLVGYIKTAERLGEDEWLEEQLTAAHEKMSTADVALSAQTGFILDDHIRRLVRVASMRIDDTSTAVILDGTAPDIADLAEALKAAFDAISARVRELYN